MKVMCTSLVCNNDDKVETNFKFIKNKVAGESISFRKGTQHDCIETHFNFVTTTKKINQQKFKVLLQFAHKPVND